MGADTKANARHLVRAPGGLLERLQRGVALQALRERSSCIGTKSIVPETASVGEEAAAEKCQRALTEKRTLSGRGGCALERGHGAPLESLAQLGDALRGVGAVTPEVYATELVERQTAMRRMWCQWALTQKQTLLSRFERGTAYLSDSSVKLPLRLSARAAPPSGPSSLRESSRILSEPRSAHTTASTVGRSPPSC